VLRRYVHGPGADEPLVWYEGSGTTDRRWLLADERGSVMAVTDSSGATIAKNSYDEYGKPGAGNIGRFQYTGQTWLSDIGLYYYKARFYSPTLGRFLQPDPIGYEGGLNVYAYAGDDPINGSDPSGLDGVYCTGSLIMQNEGTTCDFIGGMDAISVWFVVPTGGGETAGSLAGSSAGGAPYRMPSSGAGASASPEDLVIKGVLRWRETGADFLRFVADTGACSMCQYLPESDAVVQITSSRLRVTTSCQIRCTVSWAELSSGTKVSCTLAGSLWVT
jgi:RHS repeat-associated protein